VTKPRQSKFEAVLIAVGVVVLAIAIVRLIIGPILFWVGPVLSGAALLTPAAVVLTSEHRAPADYEPVHQGHVDVSTGLYVREDEDLILRGTPPFFWRRTYLSGFRASRPFGIGATHNGEWYLGGDGSAFQWVELVLPDGGRIKFDRLTPGTSYWNAVYGHTASPTSFYGAMLGWVHTAWFLKFRDGTTAVFRACGPPGTVCTLEQLIDRDGHTLSFNRDGDGLLREITGGRQRLTFEYDEFRRIVKASDTQRSVTYSYDAGGRLIQAASGEAVRSYEYDPRDLLTRIREPGREIENEYDAGERLVRQKVRRSGREDLVDRIDYTVDGDSVLQTVFTESNGEVTRYKFGPDHYETEESIERPGSDPVYVTYERAAGPFVNRLTLRCVRHGQPIVQTIPVRSRKVDDLKELAVAEYCR
jgi:YD repeat-containing protein